MSEQSSSTALIAAPPVNGSGRKTWFEREVFLLIGLSLLLYFTRLTDLTIRGEESRRGRIAWEMLHTGDWLIPRVQGLPRLSRPPLQYWAIAFVGQLHGAVDAWAVRLPCAIATLLTVLMIYAHGRCWMSRTSAFCAAAMYATFAQVLQLGRLGETEAIFTFLLSASLLSWHVGWLRNWRPSVIWTVAYTFAALATLAKGPQAPVYFAGGIGVYLLMAGRWRFAVSWSHFVGIALYLAIVAAWQIPFAMALGQERVSYVYLSEVAKRFEDSQLLTFVSHLLSFPFEVWLGCLFPWSLLLLAFGRKDFRHAMRETRKPVLFLAGCIAIAFPTVWIPPEARTRYFMPLFPCFALLCGAVVEQLVTTDFLNASRWKSRLSWITQPARFATITALIGLFYVGPIMSYQVSRSLDAVSEVEKLKQQLPEGTRLYSFGVVHHLFSFLYGAEVTHQDWPATAGDVDPELRYFCIDVTKSKHKAIPFAYEEIARINCDRNQRGKPEWEVLIARRIEQPQVTTTRTSAVTTQREALAAGSGINGSVRR